MALISIRSREHLVVEPPHPLGAVALDPTSLLCLEYLTAPCHLEASFGPFVGFHLGHYDNFSLIH